MRPPALALSRWRKLAAARVMADGHQWLQTHPPRLLVRNDVAPERGQGYRHQLEVGQPEWNSDDREAEQHTGDQVAECQPPAAEDEPQDVADRRTGAGVRSADHCPAERPQGEYPDPQRRDAERNR